MDRALELGVNFFDTANGYGGSGGRGATEEIIGRWFAARPGVRDDIVLATKVHSPMVDPTADGDVVNARGASAWQVRREAIGSLRRLQTDRIDLYQFHHIDRHISWPELWQSMETLVARGEVALHRQLELRGVEHRAGERDRAAAQLPRPGQRAVALQPRAALDRARSHPRRAELRPRHPPLVSARRRPAQRRVRDDGRSSSEGVRDRRAERARADRRVRGVRGGARVDAGRARSRVAAAPAGRDRADHRAADGRAARVGRRRRSTSH